MALPSSQIIHRTDGGLLDAGEYPSKDKTCDTACMRALGRAWLSWYRYLRTYSWVWNEKVTQWGPVDEERSGFDQARACRCMQAFALCCRIMLGVYRSSSRRLIELAAGRRVGRLVALGLLASSASMKISTSSSLATSSVRPTVM